MKENAINSKKNFARVMILVMALIVLGISGTYAYYTSTITGNAVKTTASSGKIEITSSLETANAIQNTKIALINEDEISTKAEKLNFDINNTSNSTLDGKYFVYLKNSKLSKNLYSEYFKWSLINKDCDETTNNCTLASGSFANARRTDTPLADEAENVVTTIDNIQLNSTAIEIDKNSTQNLEFRLWIQNDPDNNQIALTEGYFEGKLYIEAFPVSEH